MQEIIFGESGGDADSRPAGINSELLRDLERDPEARYKKRPRCSRLFFKRKINVPTAAIRGMLSGTLFWHDTPVNI